VVTECKGCASDRYEQLLTDFRSTPLPPISRLEDRSQSRRCARLRKVLQLCLAHVLPRYNQAYTALKPYTEVVDLEKYYDIYDISDVDFAEAMLGYSDAEFEDHESLRVLKILTARFHIMRKIFLCSLMALDATGERTDFSRWRNAVEEIQGLSEVTADAEEKLRTILSEEESKQLVHTFVGHLLTAARFPCPPDS
jgi:hypothetical protein